MTKKQVLFSLRDVLSHYRACYDVECESDSDRDYYLGHVDAIDHILEILCIYD